MRQRFLNVPRPGYLAALAVTGALSLGAFAAVTSPDRLTTKSSFERELSAISERSEEIAAFERNIRPVRLDAPETRAVPFAGFLKTDAHLKPGRKIALTRDHEEDAKLEIIDVRRITQNANVTYPAALKMTLLLVKGRLIEGIGPAAGDRIVPHNGLTSDERIVHLLFAVGTPSRDVKTPGLAAPPAQHSL